MSLIPVAFPPLPPVTEPSAAELDALLEACETDPERATLVMPISAQVIRWLLRGTFVDPVTGTTARMAGGTLRANEFTPWFRSERTK